MYVVLTEKEAIKKISPRHVGLVNEILDWCPAGSVLTHKEVSLWPWLATLVVMESQ